MGEISPPTAADYANSAVDGAREKVEEALRRVKQLERHFSVYDNSPEPNTLQRKDFTQPYSGEPLWKSRDGWYFWNEKLTEFAGGPYDTEHEARVELAIYSHELNYGPPQPRICASPDYNYANPAAYKYVSVTDKI